MRWPTAVLCGVVLTCLALLLSLGCAGLWMYLLPTGPATMRAALATLTVFAVGAVCVTLGAWLVARGKVGRG